MGSTLSSRLDAKELQELQRATAFTQDELLELYAQFRFLSDNQKLITRAQFEAGLAAAGLGGQAALSRQHTQSSSGGEVSGGAPADDGDESQQAVAFVRAPTDEDVAALTRVENLLFRLYDVMYRQTYDEPVPEDAAKDKGLSFDAFCAALSAFVSPQPEQQLEAIFRLFDDAGDDYITEEELYRALCAVNCLLELPEISTSESDDPRVTRGKLKATAAEIVGQYGQRGKLTLPQFKDAFRTYPMFAEIGSKLVVEACADFFHVGSKSPGNPALSPASSGAGSGPAAQRNTTRTPEPPSSRHLSVSAGPGDVSRPRSPVLSRNGSFFTAPPAATPYVHGLEQPEAGSGSKSPVPPGAQPPLAQCSLAHVVMHVYPMQTLQQISFVAQRHASEFTFRPADRTLHFVIWAYPKDGTAPTAAQVRDLHADVAKVTRGAKGAHHVAIKPVPVEDASAGPQDDDIEDVLSRFLEANPSNVVRLPFHASVGLHSAMLTRFSDLALIAGHGFSLVTPETAAQALVRRPRTYIFCAERSKASERAARVLGTMMSLRQRDICIVETIWSVSMNSLAHAYNDAESAWKKHLAQLREKSLKVAEHFRAKVAHGVAETAVALARSEEPANLDRADPAVVAEFKTQHEAALKNIAVGSAEEADWDGRIVQLLRRAALAPRPDGATPRTETVFVVGLQSRSMAQKFYSAAMSHLRSVYKGIEPARTAASFVFVN